MEGAEVYYLLTVFVKSYLDIRDNNSLSEKIL